MLKSNFVEKVYECAITPCFVRGESYAERSRKLASIAVAIISFPALLLVAPVAVLTAMGNPSFIGTYLVAATMVSVVITASLVPYVYLRRTCTLPDWLVDFQIWSTVPVTLCFSLFSHQSTVSILCSISVFIGIVMRVRGWPLLILYGLYTNVLHTLINGYMQELPQLHDTFYASQLLSVKIMYIFGTNIFPLFFFSLGLHAIMMEFVERADQADAAIRVCIEVAGKLRRYDTEAVGAILAANQGKVDAKLMEAFSAIQSNLQDYRPHIPDYVIANSNTDDANRMAIDDAEGDGDHDEDYDEGGLAMMSDRSYSPTASSCGSSARNEHYNNIENAEEGIVYGGESQR